MHLDVMAGVDALIKRGIADPDRLVAMGWSAGGHLDEQAGDDDRRASRRPRRRPARPTGLRCTRRATRARNRTLWFGGTPWQKNAPIATFWNHSPLKDAANVKTPTLFFVGENDVRVPLAQSIEMYRALKSQRRADASVRRAARRPPVARAPPSDLQGQHRAGLVRSATRSARTTYVPEQAPAPTDTPR